MALKRWNFKRARARMRKQKSGLPRAVGIIMLNHFKRSFRNQGFTDKVLDPWKERKNNVDPRRAILVKSSKLKRSLRVRTARFDKIAVGSYGVPYASRHNKGLDNMPQRQFVGDSKVMTKAINKKINQEIKKVFKR